MSDNEGLFARQSAPYAPFKTPGTRYAGTVVATGKVQSRKFVPPERRKAGVEGELEVWSDGRPKYTYIITVQTDQRDPTIPGDDGRRSLWIKGKQMEAACQTAVAAAGANNEGIVVGGWFSLEMTHETPNDWGGNPTKHYTATYRKPETPAAGPFDLVAGPAQTQPVDPWTLPATTPAPDPWGTAPASNPATAQTEPSLDELTPEARASLQRLLAQQGEPR